MGFENMGVLGTCISLSVSFMYHLISKVKDLSNHTTNKWLNT